MKHKSPVVKLLVSHASLALATWVLSVAAVSANPTPPPPPKPLNNNNTTASPPASSGESINEPVRNSSDPPSSDSPETRPSTAAETAPQPGPEAVPTQPLSTEFTEVETEEPLTTGEQQLQDLVEAEVDRVLGRSTGFVNWVLGAILIMIGGTWIFMWLLRRNLLKIVVDEFKQKIGGEIRAEISNEIKAEIEAEFVETLEQRANNSALAIAQPEPKPVDNSTQINELISMAVATQNLLTETRSALEESRKLHDRINQPIQEIFGIYFNQATVLSQEGNYEQAIEMYDKALQTNPDFYDAWLGRGIAFTRLQQYETAIGCYNKALQLDPEHPEPWYEKSRCYAVKGDIDLVIDNLQRAINLNPKLRETVIQDPDFELMRGDEMFNQLIQG